MGVKFAQDRELRGPHLPTKFGVSRWPRSQSPGGGGRTTPHPLAGRVMEKGLAGRGLSGGGEFFGIFGNIVRSKG